MGETLCAFSARFLFCARHEIDWRFFSMPPLPPPNDALLDLAAVLGQENVRTLVRTFLREFPVSFQALSGGERQNRHRIAHSLKSNSRLVGAHALSQRMAEIEIRLSEDNGRDITPDDLEKISADFEAIAEPLRKFVSS
jgi:HPt (histidine-containing phosphotransfer) domain-containing protein